MRYTFELRDGFPKGEVAALARRCPLADDELRAIAKLSRAAGFYTRDDFLKMCEAANASKQCYASSNRRIETITRMAIGAPSERQRIHALMRLSGISWVAASVFLHYTFENEYPTLTGRVLWSWGYNKPPDMNFQFWEEYVEASRVLASRLGISMWELDRALWQFAAEQQERHRALALAGAAELD